MIRSLLLFTAILTVSMTTVAASPARAARAMRLGGGVVMVDHRAGEVVVRVPSHMTRSALMTALQARFAGVSTSMRALTPSLVVMEGIDENNIASTRSIVEKDFSTHTWRGLARASGRAYATDELIVTAAPGRLDDALAQVQAKLDARLVRKSLVPHTALVIVGAAAGFDAVTASTMMAAGDALRSIEPNLVRELELQATVNDPLFADQWHLDRADNNDPIPGSGTIHVRAAWDTTKGSATTTIAIIDSGIDMNHPDLVDNIVPGGFDAIDDDDDPSPGCTAFDGGSEDPGCGPNAPIRESHGTAVAGLVAARGDNDEGVTGVCPQCSILPIRLIGGAGFAAPALDTAEVFIRAVDLGAAVINNSWGPGQSVFFPLAQAERDALRYARTEGRGGLGTVVLFASGNSTRNVRGDPYARDPLVMSISATDNLDNWTGYANYGAQIAVAAPSQGDSQFADFPDDDFGIVTTDVRGGTGYSDGINYDEDYTPTFGGTSAASPIAAGLVGLLLSANPALTAEQVRLVVTSTAEQVPGDVDFWGAVFQDPQGVADLFAYDSTGHSLAFGYGRIDARAAMVRAIDPAALGVAGLPCEVGCAICSVENTCLEPCTTQDDCTRGSVCDAALGACRLPTDNDIGFLAECSADVDCTYCVPGYDSNGSPTSVCSTTCETDVDCDSSCADDPQCGFDCRLVDEDQPRLCYIGSNVGDPDEGFSCANGITVVTPEGRLLCSDFCDPEGPSACPYGMTCQTAGCECSVEFQGNCFAFQCTPGAGGEPLVDVCAAANGYTETCTRDVDCQVGDYCGPDGLCRVDDRPVDENDDGCDVCKVCVDSSECRGRGFCAGTRGGQQPGRCVWGCSDIDPCPANSECQIYETRRGDVPVCVAPGEPPTAATIDELCGDFECASVCRDDIACPDGFRCNDGTCEEVVVIDVQPELSVGGAGLARGCQSIGTSSFWVLGLVWLRRRRRC
jgi:subtilisin family serine protease